MANIGAPQALTIDRLGSLDDIAVVQSTSQCCRCLCFQNTINWFVTEESNFDPGTDPAALNSNGWIHEESGLCGRSCSCIAPGCRAVKYIQHSGSPPPVLKSGGENGYLNIQSQHFTEGLTEEDRFNNVIATHEKKQTCGHCFLGYVPICNFFPLPYLDTKTTDDRLIGRSVYVCDFLCCVPKFDVLDANGAKKFHIRPDTCFLGCCVQCRCDGSKGKCCRVPFYLRNPQTKEILGAAGAEKAQIDNLWAGWKNECCTKKDAYHVGFPSNLTPEEKLLVTGSALLLDMAMFEQEDDS